MTEIETMSKIMDDASLRTFAGSDVPVAVIESYRLPVAPEYVLVRFRERATEMHPDQDVWRAVTTNAAGEEYGLELPVADADRTELSGPVGVEPDLDGDACDWLDREAQETLVGIMNDDARKFGRFEPLTTRVARKL
jgi:hypothetical protein